ncbi:acyltransferase family protein [Massilia glaciei]|uniref:acyltransferase family protein n=1 Tax=Massilia glaciei TaxID=1524097 RepID=UPI001E60378B|nr:acyltransferase [Massilia glaciei]
MEPTSRVHGLDTLRALAIVFVVLHHYVLFVSGEDTFGWVGSIGWVGVDLFFALSGYLIGNQLFAAMRSEQGLSLWRFYARRLLRTLPNFYFVLALYFCWPYFRNGLALPPLWEFLTFTQNINLRPGTAFSHAWSLCIEEQFYLVLPAGALLIASMRRSLGWAWAALALGLVGGMLVRASVWNDLVANDGGSSQFFTDIYYSTLCRLDELIAGVALALLRQYHPGLWQRLTSHGNVALAGGVALSALTFTLFLNDRYGYGVTVFGYPMLALSFGLLLVSALSPGSVLREMRVPGAASMALWSYAIYVLHKQVCILANAQLRSWGLEPDMPLAVAAMLALSVLTGWLLFRMVEAPFMALRDRYVPSNLNAPAATALQSR